MNNRNKLCFCGSGKKSKNCHKKKSASLLINFSSFAFIVFILLTWIFIFELESGPVKENLIEPYRPLKINNNISSKSKPKVTPEGKIWSYEHNHWHDDQNHKKSEKQIINQDPKNITPPKGKVWSPEHNHWH